MQAMFQTMCPQLHTLEDNILRVCVLLGLRSTNDSKEDVEEVLTGHPSTCEATSTV